MKQRLLGAALGICALLLSSLPSFAQFNASVQGTVEDRSGAAIANANIVLTNSDTQVRQKATADNAGAYRIVSLAPGNYIVEGSAAGFDTVRTPFILEASENRNVDLVLQVSTVQSNVVVTAEAPLLDTSDSREQETIDTHEIGALPLTANNALNTMQLTPGVTGLGIMTFGVLGTGSFWSNVPAMSANGRGENGNQYVLDGLDVNQDTNAAGDLIVPNADAIQEITVQTNTYAVDYGDSSSILTMFTSKSGTSQFHGFASDLYSYQGLNARGEFGPAPPTRLEPFHANNLSFGVGGPIIPKHEFFFFFAIEPYRALLANGSSVQTYEDPAFVSFAQTVQPNSPEVQLMVKYPPSGATTTSVAETAQQAFGSACGTSATDNIPCSTPIFDHGNFNSDSWNHSLNWNFRLDKYFSKDRLYGTVFRTTVHTGGPSVRPAFATTSYDSNLSIQGNYTHDFSAKTLNEAIVGYVFIQGTGPATGLFSVPVVNVTGLGVGFGDGFADGNFVENNYHWRDILSHIHGSHSLKAGYEGWFGTDIANFAGAWGQPNFQFTDMISLINNQPYTESSLAYDPVTGKPKAGNYQFNILTGGGFAEDTWKVNRKLTLNYGVRYDNFGNPWGANGSIATNFHLGSGSTMAEQVASGVMKVQSNLYSGDRNWNFSPRGGVAWDFTGDGKWVVRGGVGIFRDWVTLGTSEVTRANPPNFVLPTFYSNGSTAAPIFGYGTQNSYPFGFPYPAFQGAPLDAAGGIAGSQIAVGGTDLNLKTPRTLVWSGSIERQLSSQLVASLTYEGSHGYNQLIFQGNEGSGTFTNDVNVYAGDLIQHLTCTPVTPPNGQEATCFGVQTRLNPNFGEISYTYNGAWSNYAAFIAAIKGRFARNTFITASYTRSASKDNTSGAYPVENPLSRWYGPSSFDIPNRVSVGLNYQVPTLSRANGVAERATEGWNLSSIIILQSGPPFTVSTSAPLSVYENSSGTLEFNPGSGDFNADGDNYDFPNLSGYGTSTSRRSYVNGLFPHCSGTNLDGCGPFTLPSISSEGNESINQFRDPGFAEWDATVKKTTRIAERLNLDLRLDFFNVTNRVNLQGVDSNAADGTNFGRSTSTLNPRNAQLGAKLTF
jgi:hypothetical protein